MYSPLFTQIAASELGQDIHQGAEAKMTTKGVQIMLLSNTFL